MAFLGGIRGAAVEYEIDGMDLTYLMVPEGVAAEAFAASSDTMVTWSSQGYQIVMWRQGGGTRALVAPMPTDRLFRIADHCRRTMI